ncbi:hypothetical protein BJV78DRAFT_1249583 [Lactifluus subvellereus]|nr:hypothetical protein BJV78DRAFT_1249583 [Lactifluus subvellereus]
MTARGSRHESAPAIATVSQIVRTASSHTTPSSPRRACTPLSCLRTSSTGPPPS